MSFDLSAMAVLHGVCAAMYAALATLILLKRRQSRTGLYLAAAALVTCGWAVSVALYAQAPLSPVPRWLELAHGAAWYGFILHLYRRTVGPQAALAPVFITMGLVAVLLVGGLPFLDLVWAPASSTAFSLHVASRLALAVGTILLIENLYRNTDEEQRWHFNLLCVALGGLALYDLILYADAALFRRVSHELFLGRASATALAAPLVALTAARNRRWDIDIHVSRQAVFHSATLMLSGVFLVGLAAAGEVFRRTGAEWGLVVEVTLVFAGLLTVAVLLTSGSTRSRLRILLVDHFFSLRYDYRREWVRCIETLSAPETYVGLHTRAVRALAEVVDSPAGALYVRDPDEVAFRWAGSWNLPAATEPIPPGHSLITAFRDGNWIVELDVAEGAREWFTEFQRLWLAVPLTHRGNLLGFVLLTRSRAPFKLDREVFELLRVISREVAGRVAEQHAAQVLQQTRELREYTQRFAFVIHDIKNVSGQLSMLLTNAERHADNPDFQRDMLTTVRASVTRITKLLARLQPGAQERARALITPVERIGDIRETFQRMRGIAVAIEDDGGNAGVAIDPDSFDAVVVHLLNNAVEASGVASGDAAAVRLRLTHERSTVLVDIIDSGSGMTPEFIRDELFRPFASTKREGHGIGAYQARELLRAAGGDLLVLSRPGTGTTMRLLLPTVRVGAAEASSLPA